MAPLQEVPAKCQVHGELGEGQAEGSGLQDDAGLSLRNPVDPACQAHRPPSPLTTHWLVPPLPSPGGIPSFCSGYWVAWRVEL